MITSQQKENTTEHGHEKLIADLRELVEALDRRIPQIKREGEQQIARDSAALRKTAQERIAALKLARSDES
jgi:hypothetical protein